MTLSAESMLQTVRKGLDMTLNEQADMEFRLKELQYVDQKLDGDGCVYTPLTADQRKFIKTVLPEAIRADLPKLDEVMRVFSLTVNTVFTYAMRRRI